MKGIKKLVVTAAAGIVLSSAFETSAFADWRNRDETDRGRRGSSENRERSYRDNERVTVEGRITNMTRERDGYRVQLDRSAHSYWVPERHVRGRRNWAIGLAIGLAGIFRGGMIHVDVVNWPGGGYDGRYDRDDRYGRNDRGFVRGVVDRVDYRRGYAVIRDSYSGRAITVEMRRGRGGYRDVGLEDVRRGDYVEISGEWERGGVFDGYRIETVRQGRYR